MGSKSRKRSRAEPDENRADCPFLITVVATPSYEDSTPKRRKRDAPDDDRKELVQPSPFEPRGKFKTHQTMDLAYSIEPRKHWLDMTRYNSFVRESISTRGIVRDAPRATLSYSCQSTIPSTTARTLSILPTMPPSSAKSRPTKDPSARACYSPLTTGLPRSSRSAPWTSTTSTRASIGCTHPTNFPSIRSTARSSSRAASRTMAKTS